MRKTLFLVLGAFLIMPGLVFAYTADHLVISQVQITGGAGHTTDDFVELYNPTDSDVDLNGMRLVKRTKTGTADTLIKSWTTSTIIPAHKFYLWANSSYSGISPSADVVTTGSLADDNGVALRSGSNDTGTIIDSVAWGEAANAFVEWGVFTFNPTVNQSLERVADLDNNAADFVLTASHPRNSQSSAESSPLPNPPPQGEGTEATSTPAVTPNAASGGFSLEISELMPNPSGADAGAEWIELYNSGTGQIDLSGWILDDDDDQDFPAATAYKISEETVILPLKYLTITIPKGRFALNNSGEDALRVFDAAKSLRLRIAYAGGAAEDASYARDSLGVWEWPDTPTPDSVNVFATETAYVSDLIISEVVSNPEGDEEEGEFIEIYNPGEDSVDLTEWVLSDKTKRYVISDDDLIATEIPAGGYLAFYREATGISLNNTGEEQVSFFNPDAKLVQSLTFSAGKEGQSYSWSNAKVYQWTTKITPGRKNEFTFASEAKTDRKETSANETKTVELKNVRQMPPGQTLKTSGVVSVPSGIFGSDVIYLAGSGIRVVFEDPAAAVGLKIGDLIELSGMLKEFHGEMQLVANPDGLKILESEQDVQAHKIKTGEAGEEFEGSLVQIAGNITQTSGDTFFVDDGSGEARVLIQDSAGIDKPRTKKGDTVLVTGIVSQFNDIYRVLPRMQSDLIFGQVAGTSVSGGLPRTGGDFWLTVAVLVVICYSYSGVLIKKGKINNE